MKRLLSILLVTAMTLLTSSALSKEIHIDVVGANVIVEIDGATAIIPFDKKYLTEGNDGAIVREACKVLKCKDSK